MLYDARPNWTYDLLSLSLPKFQLMGVFHKCKACLYEDLHSQIQVSSDYIIQILIFFWVMKLHSSCLKCSFGGDINLQVKLLWISQYPLCFSCNLSHLWRETLSDNSPSDEDNLVKFHWGNIMFGFDCMTYCLTFKRQHTTKNSTTMQQAMKFW